MTKPSSYHFGAIKQKDLELDRLAKQAKSFFNLELSKLTAAGLRDSHELLDFGCGPAFLSRLLLETLPTLKVIAVDKDVDLLSICQQQLSAIAKERWQLYHGDENTIQSQISSIDFTYLRFVLQHVKNPQEIIHKLSKIVRPNGYLAALDSDDQLISYYPEIPLLSEFLERVQAKQRILGGDRIIGRKLGYFLKQAGFEQIQVQRIDFSSTQIPIELLLSILLGFKGELADLHELTINLKHQLTLMEKDNNFFLNVGVYFVSGRKS